MNLWAQNSPDKFWLCEPPITDQQWKEAICRAAPVLGVTEGPTELEDLEYLSLGEGRFGPDHWKISPLLRLYYRLKPLIPRPVIRVLRRIQSRRCREKSTNCWPTDPRYVAFQWEVLQQLLLIRRESSITYRSFWPEGGRFAFILTHDVETARGQSMVREIADLEESNGFRSSFNFVLGDYPLDVGLMRELRQRGFEIGCHGLKHDGCLFNSKEGFMSSVALVNQAMHEHSMSGFRSPLTLRNPEWMQGLDIEYDASFFDTDPFEPIPGGSMSIWPFFLGRFVELPYTLAQDYTLATILGARTPDIWLEKTEFIRRNRGMALVITHPDYLKQGAMHSIYSEFLNAVKQLPDYWHALPREVAAWWRRRADPAFPAATETFQLPHAHAAAGPA